MLIIKKKTDKEDFKASITRDKGHFMMIKVSIQKDNLIA